jgi:transposase InsO family protein
MQNMLVGNIFERLGIDLCGPFPTSYDGKNYILTCTDHFSKWSTATALPDKQATTVADALIRDVFCIYGTPLEILSDQGTEFDNKLLRNLCDRLHISKIRTSAYQPSTNGIAERIHRTINNMMGRVIEEEHTHWTDHLPFIMAAYRSAIHRSTGYTPNYLMFGRELYTPLDTIIQIPSTVETTSHDYVDKQLNRLYSAYWTVRDNLSQSMLTNKRYYDAAVNKHSYAINDWVWFYKPRNQTGKATKWTRYYSGPFRIVGRLGELNYILQQRPTSEQIVAHVDKLKAYVGPTPRDWEHDVSSSSSMPTDAQLQTADHTLDITINTQTNTNAQLPEKQQTSNCDNGRPKRVLQKPAWLKDYDVNALF